MRRQEWPLKAINSTNNLTIKANSLSSLTSSLDTKQSMSFLAGYTISESKFNLSGKANMQILQKFMSITELIRDQIFQKRNIIEATVQVLENINQQNIQSRHRMNNNNQIVISNSDRVLQIFQSSLNQLALDKNYLQNLWQRRQLKQMEDQQNQRMIQEFMQKQYRRQQAVLQTRKKQQSQNEKLCLQFLQSQKNKMRMQIQKQQKQNLQCQICLVQMDYSDVGTLKCSHIFHRQCLFQHIKSSLQQNKLQMCCPMQGCLKPLTPNDIHEHIDGPLLQKYNTFSMNHYVQKNNKDTSWCPTAGCPSIFQYDQHLTNYRCPSCKKHYCLKCRCIYHDKMTCDQYRINSTFSKSDKDFMDFVRGAKFKQCPFCNFWVEKNQGCSSLMCRCGKEFCYTCGGTACPHGRCTGSGKK